MKKDIFVVYFMVMIIYKNRGKLFERIVQNSLERIKSKGLGIFFRSPTPIKPIIVDYKSGKPKITYAVFDKKAHCDFYGIYKDKFVLIEAKETKGKSLSIKNIQEHQIEQLINVDRFNGLAIILIYFTDLDEVYGIDINNFISLTENKKSLPCRDLKNHGFELTLKNMKINIVDYLDYLFSNQL